MIGHREAIRKVRPFIIEEGDDLANLRFGYKIMLGHFLGMGQKRSIEKNSKIVFPKRTSLVLPDKFCKTADSPNCHPTINYTERLFH